MSPFGSSFNGPPTFHVRVSEGFTSALRILGAPGFNNSPGASEAGYFAPGSGANDGGATQGSRVLARFFNIPEGIRLAVQSEVGTGGLVLRLVDDANSSGVGGVLVGTSGLREISTSEGFGFAVYEVIAGDPGSQDLADIPVVVGYIADVENGLPSTQQTMQASVTLAPISFVQTSDQFAPEPRFADASGDPVSIFRVVPCGGGGSGEPITITTVSPLPTTSVGAAYNVVLQAVGGAPPYTWSENTPFNPLPPGLSLSSEGTISGAASIAGNYSVAIRVTDSEGTAVVKSFDIAVNEALTILTISPLPAARVLEPYSGTFLATGGVPPYTWAIVGGAFPSGLNFDTQTGTISGMLTEPGTAVFTVRVTDSMGAMFDKQFSLPISRGPPPIIITEASLPQAAVGEAYMTRLDAEQGVQPYSWSILGGTLPPGLTLDSISGEITGMPNLPGEFGMTVLVEDGAGETGLKEFLLQVEPPFAGPSPADCSSAASAGCLRFAITTEKASAAGFQSGNRLAEFQRELYHQDRGRLAVGIILRRQRDSSPTGCFLRNHRSLRDGPRHLLWGYHDLVSHKRRNDRDSGRHGDQQPFAVTSSLAKGTDIHGRGGRRRCARPESWGVKRWVGRDGLGHRIGYAVGRRLADCNPLSGFQRTLRSRDSGCRYQFARACAGRLLRSTGSGVSRRGQLAAVDHRGFESSRRRPGPGTYH